MAFGDLFLEDIKKYREAYLAKLGLQGVFPVWKRNTTEVIHSFVDLGFKAITVCVDLRILLSSFVGRVIDERFLRDLPQHVDPCGENGEFHTFVFDGPIFSEKIKFTLGKSSSEMIAVFAICFRKAKMNPYHQHRCSKFGRSFGCGVTIGKKRYWCQDFPQVMPMSNKDEGCICPECLKEAILKHKFEK